MNVSLRWIRDLAPDVTGDTEALSRTLAARGFPVEGIEELAAGLRDVVVGQVLSVGPHPNADRLSLCRVDAGDGEPLTVVCGAPVIHAGGFYPFAPVGATLPGDFRIRKARIRGESSFGMLCSERELGLGSDGSGILHLEGEFTPGAPLVDALGLDDVRLDVEVTSNRPDLLSHRGIARELSPAGQAGLRLPTFPGLDPATPTELPVVSDPREATAGGVTVRIEDAERCPAYLGLVIRGVQVGPSPLWLQERLRAAGSRPINNVVDATNYVLLELGHPLHAFDLDRIAEQTIVVRRAREGEGIRTLDDVDRTLTADDLVIADATRPVAVAGVMGGSESEVDENTRDVLLECALFSPGPIRSTRKRLGLSTDASYRFERGVDPEGLREAVLRAAHLMVATAGGELAEAVAEVRAEPFQRSRVSLRVQRVERVLGIPFTPERIRELLEPLGFRLTGPDDGSFTVDVPGFRSWDVTREIDLIEEIARTHGYDEFPEELGAYRPGTVPDHPLFLLEDRLRDELVARGLFEAHTLAFAGEANGEVALENPISTEEGFLRRTLLPALLRRVEYNLARGNRDVRLFELASVFRKGPEGAPPEEATHLALVLHGRRRPPHWSLEDEVLDPWDLRALVEAVGRTMGGPSEAGIRLTPVPHDDAPPAPWLTPGLGWTLSVVSGEVVGWAGAVRGEGLDLPRWAGTVWAAELRLPAEPEAPHTATFVALPAHPGVDRDLALLLHQTHPVGGVLERIHAMGGALLQDVDVFDIYEGEGIPEGHRSVAIRLRYQDPERTLKDAEVDGEVERVADLLRREFDAGIRGRGD
ncbi:MAG: phenylalanine--tRNA ligase subunit beta [Gemmatimonadales bacterium]|nr:MAG: phenylalanine--tRNA ligase subunit beta [Gemmatimonadales bacterium]